MDSNGNKNFEQRLQSVIQGLILLMLAACGGILWNLSNRASQQEVINSQTAKDVGELKTAMVEMRNQTAITTAATLAAVTTATATALAASNATIAASAVVAASLLKEKAK